MSGGKVSALINKHLVELGIDPTIPPVELLDPSFLDRVTAHAQGDDRAKASEMEHAIRKHCTVRFEENAAYHQRMSEKLDAPIRRRGEDWKTLAERFAELRDELAQTVRPQPDPCAGEHTVFRDNLAELAGLVRSPRTMPAYSTNAVWASLPRPSQFEHECSV